MLQFSSEYNQEIMISTYSGDGKVVSIQSVALQKGTSTCYVELSHFLPAVYSIQVDFSKGSLRTKMVMID